MARIVRPDPDVWNREVARKQERMARIKRYHAQREIGAKVDFREHVKQTRKHYQQKLAEVRDDPRLPDKEKYDMLGDLQREYTRAMNEARREAQDAYSALVERLEKDANPAPARGQRSTSELLERREIRDDLERKWQRDQVHVMEGYKKAIMLGDTMAMELHEQYGREYVNDPALRREFAAMAAEQIAARMSPQQRAAHEGLKELKAEEATLMLGIVHQVNLAANEAKEAANSRPFITRDDVAGRQAAGLAQTGGR
jgi:uncharacterized membrane-anchored protein YjiN (DUF445 family)